MVRCYSHTGCHDTVREAAAGKLAEQIDRLLPLLAKPIFVLCWELFFLFFPGWTVPLSSALDGSSAAPEMVSLDEPSGDRQFEYKYTSSRV